MAASPDSGSPSTPRPAARPRTGWAGFRADLRAALPDASAALVVTAVIYVVLYARIESGSSQTLQVMPFLADADEYRLYWLCQAFGWSALLWAWLTLALGLLRSSVQPRWMPVGPARVERWHRTTSLTTIGLMFAHAFMFFAELVRENEDGLGWAALLLSAFVDVFVPGGYSTGTGRVAILLGLVAFYLSIPLGLAYYFRFRTGSRLWRALHRFIVVAYVLSVWHTLLYGTNVWFDGWFRTAVWALQVPLAVLFLVRLLAPARPSERLRLRDPATRPRPLPAAARLGGRLLVAAGAVALLAVTASGRDGGRTPGAETGERLVTAGMVWAGLAVLLLVIAVTVLAVRRAERAAPGRSGARPRP
ncbi:ferric reductase-like transmembrane domain-containing protein [Marinitenerispora sediminis]|uniref:Iron reductase n=1 Tax=Marinitenerispora sediminis TaxID=1931232 RepID=A0A368T5X8_9ACTN|nr:ferric reductase-like transmembrane domain-containing protein [Marinitenerispora sediminis]RCV48218.1 iron reductase [Marinitenerispora sediminis]RCV48975.1 iron reductase [Marinitenerispora sediminis]RCV55327.1 iron reductase [Marinitenerispora sediminis]